jgi:dipeptidyl-peptidase-4
LKEVPVGAEKKDGATGTTTAKGTNFGGNGGRRKGGPEAEIEAELNDLIDSLDPLADNAVEELQVRIAELNAKLAVLQQKDAEAKKLEVAVAPPPRPKGEAAKVETVKLPETKFEILVPTNAELAANLKGHLMLVHGEIDNNVHPANTMRLADALIKANKRFDMLIIPGARHGFGTAQPYFTQRMWDFFAEHLLNDRQTGPDINIKDVKVK